MIAPDGGKLNLAAQGGERAELAGQAYEVACALFDSGILRDLNRLERDAFSPLSRSQVRAMVREGVVAEIFLNTSLSVREQPDVKDCDARARAAERKKVKAVDDPYEPSTAAELHLLARNPSKQEKAKHIVNYPADHGLTQRTVFTASMTFDAPTPEEVSANRLAFAT